MDLVELLHTPPISGSFHPLAKDIVQGDFSSNDRIVGMATDLDLAHNFAALTLGVVMKSSLFK